MRVAIDTSVLAYAEGVNDADRKSIARRTLAALTQRELVLPLQVAAELHAVLTRKLRATPAAAREAVGEWQERCAHQPATSEDVLRSAFDLATRHRFQVFDAIILSAAAKAGARLLLAEDMQDGFAWRGTVVVNPFAAEPHPLLADALAA